MRYKVFIPCAGLGSRLGTRTLDRPKPLVTVAGMPAISRVLKQFPSDSRFVVALGYKGELLREFLVNVHRELSFEFVWVDVFEGPTSGLGRTVMCARDALQEPFLFCSCDTLVEKAVPAPDFDWIGVHPSGHLDDYRTCEIAQGTTNRVAQKGQHRGDSLAYIGLAGIANWADFWQGMDQGGRDAVHEGEVCGINALAARRSLPAYDLGWHDVGSISTLDGAQSTFVPEVNATILQKNGEDIWFLDGRVVKFSVDTKFIRKRVERASSMGGFVPAILWSSPHFFSYLQISGHPLSQTVDSVRFTRFLDHATTFWRLHELTPVEQHAFERGCDAFYRAKTFQRVAQYFSRFDRRDGPSVLNGVETPSVEALLNQVDWAHLSRGHAVRFHGDLHFENILETPAGDFTFIDWREEFARSPDVGDLYYDLAKLLHGIIVNHDVVRADKFTIYTDVQGTHFAIEQSARLREVETLFYEWLRKNGYEEKKVDVLTALVFLNIAALHHEPYSHFLLALGKSRLAATLNRGN